MNSISHRFLVSLITVLTAAVLFACSDNPAVRSRYTAEKMFFEAERLAAQYGIRPQSGSNDLGGPVYDAYNQTALFCYDALSEPGSEQHVPEYRELAAIAYGATNRLVGMTYTRERFDTCVSLLQRVIQSLPLDRLGTATTYLNLGSALQADGKWDSALSVFLYSLDNFYPPVDDSGEIVINLLNLPTHIYDVYIMTGDSAGAGTHAPRAERYYRQLIDDRPGTMVAAAAHLNLASLYERLQRWDEAVQELGFLVDSGSTTATAARLKIASIHASYLDQPRLAIEQYDEILRNLSGADTLSRPLVMFNKGLVYLHQGNYGRARETFIEVRRNYPRFYDRMPTVQFAIARTYELQGDWDRAETEYKFLINNYPTSEQSLSTYLYLIDQYVTRDRMAEAERMETRARTVYDDIARDHKGAPAEATALTYKAELLQRRRQWQAAADLLTDVFDRFSTSEVGFRDLVTAAAIYRDQLGRPQTADSLIQELKRRLTTVDEPGEI